MWTRFAPGRASHAGSVRCPPRRRREKVATIDRQFSTIAKAHRIANVDPSPVKHSTVQQVLMGIRRKLGRPQEQKEAAIAEMIRQMVTATREHEARDRISARRRG